MTPTIAAGEFSQKARELRGKNLVCWIARNARLARTGDSLKAYLEGLFNPIACTIARFERSPFTLNKEYVFQHACKLYCTADDRKNYRCAEALVSKKDRHSLNGASGR